jgi:membrane fusion protein, adhesin transport system
MEASCMSRKDDEVSTPDACVEVVKPLVSRAPSSLRTRAEDIEFMRETIAAALEGPRRFTHIILWGTVAFLILAFSWAALANVDEFTVAEGKVIPSSQVQVVQNLEGGIVSEILVQVGQTVEKDQVLMRIDATRFAASAQEGEAKDQALIARIARLAAEASSSEFVPSQKLEQHAPRLVAEERALFASKQKQLTANELVLRQQAEQRRLELAEKRARETQLQKSLELVEQELTMTRPLVREGVVSQVDVLRLERQASDLKGERDAARLAIPRLVSAQEEVQRKIEELKAHFRADANEELNKARAEQSALSAANSALVDRVNRTAVRAPVAGIVKQLKINTVGGVIQPGMDLMEIVPLADTLLVEARVRPADIAFLRPGQSAMVKLSAYDYSIYGGFPATLEHISADTLTTDRPGEKSESYYQVRVRTTQMAPRAGGRTLPILPGMVATVDIQTGKRTVLHYFLKPIIKTKEMALRER